MPKTDREILAQYLPENAVDTILQLIIDNTINLHLKNKRSSKLGDFRLPSRGKVARISVNADLNKYAFLITLVHEIAHWFVWAKYKNYHEIQPHGIEWKRTFSGLMYPFLNADVFPQELLSILKKHMQNPKASSSADVSLVKALRKYDANNTNSLRIYDLEIGQSFIFKQIQFKIMEKKRTRYLCREELSKKLFLINGLAEITPI